MKNNKMDMDRLSSEEGMKSLNDTYANDFNIEELETRYETDPLFLSHIFGLAGDDGRQDIEPLCACKKLQNCPELTCVVDTCPEYLIDDKS